MSDYRYALRSAVIMAALIVAAVLLHASSRGSSYEPARQPLRTIPLSIQTWTGADLPLEERIVEAAGVNDYVNRLYKAPDGSQIELYIGYYKNQRSGDVIHSPRNCLPGAGWEPVQTGRLPIRLPDGSSIAVNDFLIQKGLDRRLVLYWYEGRGRAIASEYSAKMWMIADAMARNRTDGALVRMAVSMPHGETTARVGATRFVQALYPSLHSFIPN